MTVESALPFMSMITLGAGFLLSVTGAVRVGSRLMGVALVAEVAAFGVNYWGHWLLKKD